MTEDKFLDDLDAYIDRTRPLFERELETLVNIPTVSADPAHQKDIIRGAEAAAELLRAAGFQVELVKTSGNPIVFGQLLEYPGSPTVAIYNHLDVQPADPAAWKSDPFALVIEGDRYIGRGSTDDKGPALTALAAIRYAHEQKMPLNFKVIWELEEEVGSTHFEDFVRGEHNRLTSDSVVLSDTIWIADGKPAIPVGLRGMALLEVSLETAEADVHSGLAGGAARNPLGEIMQLITDCYDAASGDVKIPGFYDDVVPPSSQELDDFVASGFSVIDFMKDHGLRSLRTKDVREVVERIMARPTFEVHGIVGGYTGPDVMTVIPPRATVKVSMRLVPNQDPGKVAELVERFIHTRCPDATVRLVATLAPYLVTANGPHLQAAVAAMQYGFGVKPALIREGGSIGAVLTMAKYIQAPVVMPGLSLPAHGYHAPNEYFEWAQASGGIRMYVDYFRRVTRL
ncbi:MAG TPA: M20/M25/M40 family metallo-hydrolase [Verrucomicrobiae bacterium]|nr:M20/M25/M40 family metallo-hydrolase [Verrucomicrobiae bacterium]